MRKLEFVQIHSQAQRSQWLWAKRKPDVFSPLILFGKNVGRSEGYV